MSGHDKIVKRVSMTQDPPVKGISGGSGCKGALWGDVWANTEPNRCARLTGQSESSSGMSRPSASQEQSCGSLQVAEQDSLLCNADCPESPRVSGRQRKSLHATAGLFLLELLLLYLQVKNTDQSEDLQRFQSMHLGTQCPIRYQTAIKFSRTQTAKHSCTAGLEALYALLYSALHHFNNI